MTLHDLLRLLKRYFMLVVALPIACLIGTVAVLLLMPPSYVATSSFVTSGDLALAQGLASKEAASYSSSQVHVSSASLSSSKQVTITAVGADQNLCITAANEVANNAVKQYREANSSIVGTVSEATYAMYNGPSMIRSAIVAFFAGLLIAIFVIILLDAVKLPIKSRKDVEDESGFPVLGVAPSLEGGERLLANLQFCCNMRPSTIAVVPVGAETTAPIVARELAGALERSDVRVKLVKGSPHAKKFQVTVPEDAAIVVSCEPLDAGMGAAYIAHNADVTVLCVSEWTDSKRQLAATVQELELAKANIAGVTFLPEPKKAKEPKREKQVMEGE